MRIQESGENYLETILLLKRKQGVVRSIDVANAMGFSKPSISRAMAILKENGYLTVEPNGNLELTEKGIGTATEVYERHRYITAFLADVLGVSPETADADACRIEHIISEETFRAIKSSLQAHTDDK